MTIKPPKNKICISLLDEKDHQEMGVHTQSILGSHTNYRIKDFDFNNNQKTHDDIIELVKKLISQYGSLDELILMGHGGPDGYVQSNNECGHLLLF